MYTELLATDWAMDAELGLIANRIIRGITMACDDCAKLRRELAELSKAVRNEYLRDDPIRRVDRLINGLEALAPEKEKMYWVRDQSGTYLKSFKFRQNAEQYKRNIRIVED